MDSRFFKILGDSLRFVCGASMMTPSMGILGDFSEFLDDSPGLFGIIRDYSGLFGIIRDHSEIIKDHSGCCLTNSVDTRPTALLAPSVAIFLLALFLEILPDPSGFRMRLAEAVEDFPAVHDPVLRM